MKNIYDVIVIGGGAGGLSAAIYAGRSKMKTLVIEEQMMGGEAAMSEEVYDYPGFPEATGSEVMEKFVEHCEKFDVELTYGKVEKIELLEDGSLKKVFTKNEEFITKTIIVAMGDASVQEPRTLDIKGGDKFQGKGFSYCATCDASFFEELDVVVVGSGNTAVDDAVFLTKYAEKVTMIVAHEEGVMDADKESQKLAKDNPKIDFAWNSEVAEIGGEGLVGYIKVKNTETNEVTKLDCNGVFISVGTVARTNFLEGIVELTSEKYIKVNEKMETNVPGIFACSNVTDKQVSQLVTAAGDGAVAAVAAEEYIKSLKAN